MRGSLWVAQAHLNGKQIHLGYHGSELAAAKAYDNWAKDFSHLPLNFLERASSDVSPVDGVIPSPPSKVLPGSSTAKSFTSINDTNELDDGFQGDCNFFILSSLVHVYVLFC